MLLNFFIFVLLLIFLCCVVVYGQDDLIGMWCECLKCICIMRLNSVIYVYECLNFCFIFGRIKKFYIVL